MRRFVVFDRKHDPLFDLDERIVSAVRTEKLKGEHKLDVETTQPLEEGMRILVREGTLKWREWVVDEPDEHHTEEGMVGTYGCTWSMQYDLASKDGGELWPGTYSPIAAGAALAMVLATQSTWEVGYVTVGGTSGTSLYDGSVWDYLGELQEVWGGEMEPRIVVDGSGVTHRYVDWYAHVGQTEATRRFDFGEDCTSIRRKVAPGPRFCRVVPRGGRDAQDADGVRYSARCGVEEEPYRADGDFVHDANSKYVRDTVAEQLFRTKDRHGNWHYPEKVVCYDLDLQGDQEELLNKAMAEVAEHTRPKTTYEADVLQFAAAGLDPHGVQLGDEVQIVDRAFGDAPLRLQARVVEMTVNELDDTDVSLVIGEPNADLASSFKSLSKSIADADGRAREIQAGGTIAYVENLLDAINAQIAADGGYTYLVSGQGSITYDKSVADPIKGTEATRVTQMKGGSLRFAKSKKSGFQDIDDWNWTNVITADGYLGLAATIAAITTGFIGSVGDTYINLDEHIAQIGQSSGPHLIVDANGVWVYNASTLLGFFGLESSRGLVRLGETGQTRTEIDWHSLQLIDREDNTYMYVSDLRDADGYATVTDTYVRWNINTFYMAESIPNSDYTIEINGVDRTSEFRRYPSYFYYNGSGTLSDGTVVNVTYKTSLSRAKAYTLGLRKADSPLGIMSFAEGYLTEASGAGSHAEGYYSQAAGIASHAEGGYPVYNENNAYYVRQDIDPSYPSKALGIASHAESGGIAKGPASRAFFKGTAIGFSSVAHGLYAEAKGNYGYAIGPGTVALDYQFVYGSWNVQSDSQVFTIGIGTSSSRATGFYVSDTGNGWFKGSCTATSHPTSSDKRLKKHVGYIGNDMCDFVRRLKPVRYRWANGDDGEHYGFYAQDVADADPYRTSIVSSVEDGNGFGFDPLTLDYNALIAPLVAYTQQLEKRIDEQQQQIDALTRRLDALEGGA